VNRGDAEGVTPLHGAVYFGYEGIQQLLIQRGAKTDLVDDRGYMPAQYAQSQGKTGSTDNKIPMETVQPISAAQAGVARLHLPLIKIDGSSTVYPLSELVAERYAETGSGNIRVTVGISGTGGGFQKFCRGETDIQDASRPISAVESELCQRNGIQFFELPVGYDALSVVVSMNNTWVESLTLKELKAMWEPEAHMKTTSWNQIRNDWPAVPLRLFGAGPDSGSFDYFTEAVVGKAKSSRADYTGSEDDNVLVDAIAASRLALGYVPFAYLEPNRQRLKAVAIDAGNGPILPTRDTVVSGQYHPLSRPIFLYVNKRSAIDSAVRQFVEYYLSQAPQFVDQIGCVPFPTDAYASILAQFRKGKLGTIFEGKSPIGMTIEQFLSLQGIAESVPKSDS
jgi:phosphate transport system substrate-binding protein